MGHRQKAGELDENRLVESAGLRQHIGIELARGERNPICSLRPVISKRFFGHALWPVSPIRRHWCWRPRVSIRLEASPWQWKEGPFGACEADFGVRRGR